MITLEEIKLQAESFDAKAAAAEVAEWVCGNIESFIDNHNTEFSIGFSTRDAEGLDHLRKIEETFESLGIAESGISDSDIKQAAMCGLSEADQKRAEEIVGKFNAGEIVSGDDLDEIKQLLALAQRATVTTDPLFDVSREQEIDEEAKKLIVLYGMIDEVKDILSTDKDLLEKLYDKLIFYYELCGFRDGRKVERDLEGYVRIDEFEYFAYDIPVQATVKTPRVDEDGNVALDDDGNVIIDVGETFTERIPPSFNLDISIDYWEKKPMDSLF